MKGTIDFLHESQLIINTTKHQNNFINHYYKITNNNTTFFNHPLSYYILSYFIGQPKGLLVDYTNLCIIFVSRFVYFDYDIFLLNAIAYSIPMHTCIYHTDH